MSKYERKEKSQRKHIPSSSGASKSPATPPSNRPGWKGPGFTKKASRPTQPSQSGSQVNTASLQPQLLPLELQQLLLNIFRDTFPASQDFDALKPVLQEVKDALFQRDFERAFGKAEFLEAYAVRWSPSRALGYANVIAWLCEDVGRGLRWVEGLLDRKETSNVVCVGGGAAEVMAFGAAMRYLRPDLVGRPESGEVTASEDAANNLEKLSMSEGSLRSLDLTLIDTADWSEVVGKLQAGLATAPILHKYASASARASNASFIAPEAMKTTFVKNDVLRSGIQQEDAVTKSTPIWGLWDRSRPTLITLLFTLNELYSDSISKTTAFLLEITKHACKDSLLLVIDSPGSYSETSIGSTAVDDEGAVVEKKKHPMHWLMEYALLGKFSGSRGNGEEGSEKEVLWEKIYSEESRWFRLLEGLKYPVSLENMRFQIHLFKRL